jgi:hypothetical protein
MRSSQRHLHFDSASRISVSGEASRRDGQAWDRDTARFRVSHDAFSWVTARAEQNQSRSHSGELITAASRAATRPGATAGRHRTREPSDQGRTITKMVLGCNRGDRVGVPLQRSRSESREFLRCVRGTMQCTARYRFDSDSHPVFGW